MHYFFHLLYLLVIVILVKSECLLNVDCNRVDIKKYGKCAKNDQYIYSNLNMTLGQAHKYSRITVNQNNCTVLGNNLLDWNEVTYENITGCIPSYSIINCTLYNSLSYALNDDSSEKSSIIFVEPCVYNEIIIISKNNTKLISRNYNVPFLNTLNCPPNVDSNSLEYDRAILTSKEKCIVKITNSNFICNITINGFVFGSYGINSICVYDSGVKNLKIINNFSDKNFEYFVFENGNFYSMQWHEDWIIFGNYILNTILRDISIIKLTNSKKRNFNISSNYITNEHKSRDQIAINLRNSYNFSLCCNFISLKKSTGILLRNDGNKIIIKYNKFYYMNYAIKINIQRLYNLNLPSSKNETTNIKIHNNTFDKNYIHDLYINVINSIGSKINVTFEKNLLKSFNYITNYNNDYKLFKRISIYGVLDYIDSFLIKDNIFYSSDFHHNLIKLKMGVKNLVVERNVFNDVGLNSGLMLKLFTNHTKSVIIHKNIFNYLNAAIVIKKYKNLMQLQSSIFNISCNHFNYSKHLDFYSNVFDIGNEVKLDCNLWTSVEPLFQNVKANYSITSVKLGSINNDCIPLDLIDCNKTCNNGVCVIDFLNSNFTCDCDPYYVGYYCNVSTISDCSLLNNCTGNGLCIVNITNNLTLEFINSTCLCNSTFTGEDCSILIGVIDQLTGLFLILGFLLFIIMLIIILLIMNIL